MSETGQATPEMVAAEEAHKKVLDAGHDFNRKGEIGPCSKCGLHYHDFLELAGATEVPIVCPYVSEKLEPSDDPRVNR